MSNHERSHEVRHEAKDISKDKKKGKKAIIAAVATGVLVLGVGGALISGHLNRSSPEANNNPTNSQQANETETTPSGPQIPGLSVTVFENKALRIDAVLLLESLLIVAVVSLPPAASFQYCFANSGVEPYIVQAFFLSISAFA